MSFKNFTLYVKNFKGNVLLSLVSGNVLPAIMHIKQTYKKTNRKYTPKIFKNRFSEMFT